MAAGTEEVHREPGDRRHGDGHENEPATETRRLDDTGQGRHFTDDLVAQPGRAPENQGTMVGRVARLVERAPARHRATPRREQRAFTVRLLHGPDEQHCPGVALAHRHWHDHSLESRLDTPGARGDLDRWTPRPVDASLHA